MKRTLIAAVILFSLSATPAIADPTLKQQLAAQKAKVAKLQGQLAKAEAAAKSRHRKDTRTITTLSQDRADDLVLAAKRDDQILALTAQVTRQAQGGVAAVLAGSPTDLWNAVGAIWQAFPKLASGQSCGYDKANTAVVSTGSSSTTWTFSLTTCPS